MTRRQRLFSQVGVVAIGLAACLLATTYPPAFQPWILVSLLLPGAAFLAAGVAAWSLRPGNRLGPLMVIAGIGLLVLADRSVMPYWSLPAVTDWLVPLLSVVSFPVRVIPVHLVLAFPTGRLSTQLDRRCVGALYGVMTLCGLPVALGPDFHQPELVLFAGTLAGLLELAAYTLATAAVVRRWVRSAPAGKRGLRPVLWCLGAATAARWLGPLLGLAAFEPGTLFWFSAAVAQSGFQLTLALLPAGILIGLLRSDLDMSSIGEVVVKLSHGLLPEQVEPMLAQALHDPSLKVVYWLSTMRLFGDLDGNPVDIGDMGAPTAVTVLGDPAEPVAALLHDRSLRPEGVDAAGAALLLALENARLQAQLRAQLREVRQSRERLVEAADRERRRVERDLHDGAQQELVTLLLSLQLAKTEAQQRSEPETVTMLEANIQALKHAVGELRELARGIHPAILVEAGAVPALRSLAERCPLPVEISGNVGRLDPTVEAALYFVAAEAITNAVKHSKGHKVCIDLQRYDGRVTLDVSDDGEGGADASRGTGLMGLSDRIAAVGGRLDLDSRPGRGTRLHAEVPCA